MVADNVFDHPEVAPMLSVAIALTRYVPAALQVWDAFDEVPELTRLVTEVVPSPQSKVYLTWFPSGSVAEVE